jgi:hypothetical protein
MIRYAWVRLYLACPFITVKKTCPTIEPPFFSGRNDIDEATVLRPATPWVELSKNLQLSIPFASRFRPEKVACRAAAAENRGCLLPQSFNTRSGAFAGNFFFRSRVILRICEFDAQT